MLVQAPAIDRGNNAVRIGQRVHVVHASGVPARAASGEERIGSDGPFGVAAGGQTGHLERPHGRAVNRPVALSEP